MVFYNEWSPKKFRKVRAGDRLLQWAPVKDFSVFE